MSSTPNGFSGPSSFPMVVSTIRAVLDVAVSLSWPIRQIDVNNAFLQGTLTEDVYVTQPQVFVDPDRPTHVCHLKKALYGLKQAPIAWYLELKNYLVSVGFSNSLSDTLLFVLKRPNLLVYALIYVDNILITGNNVVVVEAILKNLGTRFSVKDMGELSYFLGIEAIRTKAGLHLNQRKYVLDLLTKMNMQDAKLVPTPMVTTPKLTLVGDLYSDPKKYRTLIGSLQYLAFTRPYIAYVVNRLSQFMHSPTNDHWQAAKRVLRYLAGTSSYGLYFRKGNPLTLHGFSNADWAGYVTTCVSTNGYIIYLGGQPISWTSKKQKGVARSSTEAEYRAVANTSSELLWVNSLLSELGLKQTSAPTIYYDNVGATYLCANPVFHSRMKHIAIDYHFIREKFKQASFGCHMFQQKINLLTLLQSPYPEYRFNTCVVRLESP
ncbi:PREDICTED: uncharacterized protein LOC109126424 [Camelina sativa]|uniref:Uncharacterized protein LOC109126424 n=1 Tax=Camelina sativa TaxID=90675 RepID=A0ABM1QFG5_CAMSA|nr:PREDICTED: uncharacterized protein LOC109126424 [Camelina sativa]